MWHFHLGQSDLCFDLLQEPIGVEDAVDAVKRSEVGRLELRALIGVPRVPTAGVFCSWLLAPVLHLTHLIADATPTEVFVIGHATLFSSIEIWEAKCLRFDRSSPDESGQRRAIFSKSTPANALCHARHDHGPSRARKRIENVLRKLTVCRRTRKSRNRVIQWKSILHACVPRA